jgi:hypothetical protein
MVPAEHDSLRHVATGLLLLCGADRSPRASDLSRRLIVALERPQTGADLADAGLPRDEPVWLQRIRFFRNHKILWTLGARAQLS